MEKNKVDVYQGYRLQRTHFLTNLELSLFLWATKPHFHKEADKEYTVVI